MWGETDELGSVIRDLTRNMDYRIERGFVSAVRCKAAAWLKHGDTIRAGHPVRTVTLTTIPAVSDDGRDWFFVDDPLHKTFASLDINFEAARETDARNGVARPNGQWLRALCRLRWPGITFDFA
jgi:hypothetical protein